ncbi:MAG: type I restriction enzyme HsdR N-terminal domain-containing protein [Sphingobacteriaceae bacterium]|nr:type I restriction enzyme HsdR N-terminal domain-containing protein [Sphingobacteriaceae bacterium]
MLLHITNIPHHLSLWRKEIELNGIKKRYDVVVYNKQLQPFIIVECKAPGVELSQDVLEQASRYNLILNVEYVFITNGLNDQLYKAGTMINDLPRFDEFSGNG